MSTTTEPKVYGLFYRSHGTWTPFRTQPLTLNTARTAKNNLRRAYKSKVIIRKVKFAA
jgi:hypothetical protein